MSGLRPSPRVRAERLAREVRRRELEERRAGMSAPELAWERALELAPAEEIEELGRLEALSLMQEPRSLPMLETLQSMWALQERMFSRLQRLSHDFYGRAKVGDIMARLSSDLLAVQPSLDGAAGAVAQGAELDGAQAEGGRRIRQHRAGS